MEEPNKVKAINIREVVYSKSPKVAKMLPGFVYKYIHRIMHIDEINQFLSDHGHLKEIDFLTEVVNDFKIQEEFIGAENIPNKGRFIFACNHPLGGFDAMVLMIYVNKVLGGLKFLANDVIMNIPNLGELPVPINKHGRHGREAAKLINETYTSNNQILLFPSGLASRRIKGKIIDLEWKKHFISKAIESKRDVIPVFITGKNSNRFYIIANLRKFFRIKWNLEMFFLADETFRHRGKHITFYFGKPLPYTMFDKSKTHQQWAYFVKDLVYKLPSTVNPIN